MRSYLPGYDLRVPASLDEALRCSPSRTSRWRPFAGGTDLMVLLEAGQLPHTHYVSLWGLDALRGIAVADDEVDPRRADHLHRRARERPPLAPSSRCSARRRARPAASRRRTAARIGGNIANASPAADTPPALLVYDAELDLVSAQGPRRVPYAAFHTGYKKMDLAPTS